ncbi:MAG: hypothetical protein Q7R91_00160 [bacterium]|nr:hypothetical protein [bacterium]
MTIKDFLQSKMFKTALYCLAGVIVILMIFQAGIFVGYRKAAFSYRWGDNYYRNFGERHGDFMENLPRDKDFSSAHGAMGKIIKIELPTLILAGSDNIEKVIVIKDDTIIRRLKDAIKPEDMKADEFAVIIGTPNENAQIEAKLIRLLPYPPQPIMDKNQHTK